MNSVLPLLSWFHLPVCFKSSFPSYVSICCLIRLFTSRCIMHQPTVVYSVAVRFLIFLLCKNDLQQGGLISAIKYLTNVHQTAKRLAMSLFRFSSISLSTGNVHMLVHGFYSVFDELQHIYQTGYML